jgi:hypothetical protein
MSRIYGRAVVGKTPGGRQIFGPWQVVQTDANGFNDAVNITWLAQALKLNINESPFYGAWGIPGKTSVQQQVAPDLYMSLTQQRFAPFFAALTLARAQAVDPTYSISIITQNGSKLPTIFVAAPPQ